MSFYSYSQLQKLVDDGHVTGSPTVSATGIELTVGRHLYTYQVSQYPIKPRLNETPNRTETYLWKASEQRDEVVDDNYNIIVEGRWPSSIYNALFSLELGQGLNLPDNTAAKIVLSEPWLRAGIALHNQPVYGPNYQTDNLEIFICSYFNNYQFELEPDMKIAELLCWSVETPPTSN